MRSSGNIPAQKVLFHIDLVQNIILDICMEEWDPAINDFVFRCNSCWRTNKDVKIIRTSREKYYCQDCLNTYDLCHS
jgi:late competence protein required for DNA uptake (superfamily II DNA/RNA helicase)